MPPRLAFVGESGIHSTITMAFEQFRRQPLYVLRRDQAGPDNAFHSTYRSAPQIGAEAAAIMNHRMISLNVFTPSPIIFVQYVEVRMSLNVSIIHRTPIF
jgi:hypothetical protein